MINSLLIGKAIYSILASNEALLEKVKILNICPLAANEETVTFPFIIFGRTSTTPSYCKDGNVEDQCTIEFYIADRDYANSCEIANIVRNAFEMKRGNIDGLSLSSILLTSANELCIYEDGQITYIQTLVFNIKAR